MHTPFSNTPFYCSPIFTIKPIEDDFSNLRHSTRWGKGQKCLIFSLLLHCRTGAPRTGTKSAANYPNRQAPGISLKCYHFRYWVMSKQEPRGGQQAYITHRCIEQKSSTAEPSSSLGVGLHLGPKSLGSHPVAFSHCCVNLEIQM